eukprot:6179312-Lingulodinium_polyedra.AAC.1
MGLAQLRLLAEEEGVEAPSPPDLYHYVAALVQHFLPGLSEADYQAIMAKRGEEPEGIAPEDLPEEVLEEMGAGDDAKDVQASGTLMKRFLGL